MYADKPGVKAFSSHTKNGNMQMRSIDKRHIKPKQKTILHMSKKIEP